MHSWSFGLAMMLAAGPAPAPSAVSFCAKMAAELGMTSTRPTAGKAAWQLPTLNLAQRLLVGGTSVVAVQPQQTAPSTPADDARIEEMCQTNPKGVVCNVAGPAALRVRVKDKTARIVAEPGERADVRFAGVHLRCEDR